MKRILITGEGSYIGISVDRYLQEYNAREGREEYRVDTISLRGESWENYDFSCYDSVFHVAGIAHSDVGGVSEERKAMYYQVNCDLAVKTAVMARNQGVGQFIYMSSMIVYGDSAPVGKKKVITKETVPSPANFYGDSKLMAEKELNKLAGLGFQVACLRPPMIYGRGSKGNYPLLVKMAGKLPVFPYIKNERSMLYVENLCEFVRLLADSGLGGIFYPQNDQYVKTSEMVRAIGRAGNKKIGLWKILNPFVYLASRVPGKIGGMVNKAFGSLVYEQGMSREGIDGYQNYGLEESIIRSEDGKLR